MESLVEFEEDKGILTKRAVVIRSIFVFLGYVFIFLAGASELRDVLDTFFKITISPRQALLIVSLLQLTVWLFWGFYPLYKDKSFVISGYILMVFLLVFLASETEMGPVIFEGFNPGFRLLGTCFIILSIIGAGGYTSLAYYSKNVSN